MLKLEEEYLINNKFLVQEDNYISNLHFVLEKQYIDTSDVTLLTLSEVNDMKIVEISEGASLKQFLENCPSYELKPTGESNKKCLIFEANGGRILLDKYYHKHLIKIPHIKFLSDGNPMHQVYIVIQAGLMKKVIGCVMPCV